MANFNYNKVILGGRLTADPELKQTNSGTPVCSFSVAVNRAYSGESKEKTTDFINCTAWRKTAEFLCKYFKKGSCVCLEGQLNVRAWEDKDGKKRFSTEVNVENVCFVDGKNDSVTAENGSHGAETSSADTYEVIKDDSDLPF